MAAQHHLASTLDEKSYFPNIKNKQLFQKDLLSCQKALELDRDAFLFNAVNSFSGIITSIIKRNYSWAIVKAYYTVFYLARVNLSQINYAVVYEGSKPYVIHLNAGECFKKGTGKSSHDVVLNLFKEKFPHHYLLSNNIGSEQPIDWFKTLREKVNYKQNPMQDPNPPETIEAIDDDLRGWLNTYLNDSTGSYIFSAEHAFMAYTLKFLILTFDEYHQKGQCCKFIGETHLEYFQKSICDENGPFRFILEKLNPIIEKS